MSLFNQTHIIMKLLILSFLIFCVLSHIQEIVRGIDCWYGYPTSPNRDVCMCSELAMGPQRDLNFCGVNENNTIFCVMSHGQPCNITYNSTTAWRMFSTWTPSLNCITAPWEDTCLR
jgi:hypothetical protein